MSIQKGMTKNEILRLLRTPDYRNFDREIEEWVYVTPNKNLIIGFFNEQVETMNTYPAGTYYNRSAYPGYYDNSSSYPPVYSPSGSYNLPTDERDFQQLYDAVKRESFKDNQFQVLRNGVYNRSFTVNQSLRMMSIYSFDDDKLRVLEIMAPKIIDRENQDQLLSAFSYISSRENAQSIMNMAVR